MLWARRAGWHLQSCCGDGYGNAGDCDLTLRWVSGGVEWSCTGCAPQIDGRRHEGIVRLLIPLDDGLGGGRGGAHDGVDGRHRGELQVRQAAHDRVHLRVQDLQGLPPPDAGVRPARPLAVGIELDNLRMGSETWLAADTDLVSPTSSHSLAVCPASLEGLPRPQHPFRSTKPCCGRRHGRMPHLFASVADGGDQR